MEQLNQRNTEDEGKIADFENTVGFRRWVILREQLNAIHFENEGTEKKQQKKTELIKTAWWEVARQ